MSLQTTDIAIIGTGFAGLGMAIRLQQAGRRDFVILEKADEVGGTWRDNNYPGCACDVQSHLYSFSFEPNPDWSRLFAPQAEILGYLQGCARKHALYPKIRFHSPVTGARWDENSALWTLDGEQGPLLRARIVITGLGGLSRPSIPEIPGLEDFAGEAFHSQQWRHDLELRGRRVAVIGTGASAIQFVPQIAPQVERLDLYQRTPPWILPKPDRLIGLAERQLFRRLPQTQKALRTGLYWQMEARAVGFVIDPRLMALPERWARNHLRRQVPDAALRRRLTPDYTIGCKRILISNDYYPALTRRNVDVLDCGIRRITDRGIIGRDGRLREVDTIIFGTGFAATDPIGGTRVTGRAGADLRQTLDRTGTQAYKGTSIAGFPNLFMLTGPNTGLGHNSMVYMIESQIDYVLKALEAMQRRALRAVDVKASVQSRFNAALRGKLDRSVWSAGGCRSWYLDAQGRNVTLWPDFSFKFRLLTRQFRLADYHLDPAPRPAPEWSPASA